MTAARMQRDEQIVLTTSVDLGDSDAVAKVLENLCPA